MKVINGDLRFTLRNTTFCCGLQEMGDFGFIYSESSSYAEVVVDPAEVSRIKSELQYTASTYAVTVNDAGEYPTQRCAGLVLEAVGFKKVHEFSGNGGNPLIMWVYDRS